MYTLDVARAHLLDLQRDSARATRDSGRPEITRGPSRLRRIIVRRRGGEG